MAKDADDRRGVTASTAFGGFDTGVVTTPNSYLSFKRLDLSRVRELALSISTQSRLFESGGIGGTVEIRQDSPSGVLLGQATIEGLPGGLRSRTVAPSQTGQRGAGRGRATEEQTSRGGGRETSAQGGVADQTTATVTAALRGAYGGIEGGQYDNVGSAVSVVARTPTTTVPLKRTQGKHDLFIVFKNASAKPDDVLMTLTAIRFVLDDPAGGSRSPQ